jgi:hypothetical protein
VTVGGREFEIRELTWGEAVRVAAESDSLPLGWPAAQQFDAADLAGLYVSEVEDLSRAILSLTRTGSIDTVGTRNIP